MIASTIEVSAPTDKLIEWSHIQWNQCYKTVRKLQARIVKATQEGRWNKVKALQHLLTSSFSGKALAVRRVVENKGKNTPGVDGEIWSTPEAKSIAIKSLKRRGYKTKPLRRVAIPKSNGNGQRPLSIPTLKDRAMQALYALALEPIAETTADRNSYGFRVDRSTADAIEQCYIVLGRKCGAEWVLEADIRKCFDSISHDWLIANIPMDKAILKKWLKAGFMKSGKYYPTEAGTAQGGIISPLWANMALDGLGKMLEKKFPMKISFLKPAFKVNYVRYCDDFIITGRSKELLEKEVKPIVEDFLQQRGLSLSPEKTKITHINGGFDFLGQNIRKYKGKLLIKPSKKSVKNLLQKMRKVIKKNKMVTQDRLIQLLNPIIRGWTAYHRHVCSKSTFTKVRYNLWQVLWRWARRRHPTKNAKWVKEKYFTRIGNDHWCFALRRKLQGNAQKSESIYYLVDPTKVPIKRHIKIKAECNPFDPSWEEYLERYLTLKTQASLSQDKRILPLWKSQEGKCLVCKQNLSLETGWHIHHLLERSKGGDNRPSNLVLLHPVCHRQAHVQKLQLVKPVLNNKGLQRLEPYDAKVSRTVLRGREEQKRSSCYPAANMNKTSLIAGLLVSVMPAYAAVPMNDQQVMEVSISGKGLTRLSVQGDVIQDIFVYPFMVGEVVTHESIQLHKSGHVFIAPDGFKGSFYLTVMTQKGQVQD